MTFPSGVFVSTRPMRSCRLAERQDTVDEDPERAVGGELERAFQVFSAVRPQAADDTQALLV
jgi:hypothetical protein